MRLQSESVLPRAHARRVNHPSGKNRSAVDRLMHHGDVYYLKGESYRIRGRERTALPVPAAEPGSENPEGSSGS